ncbi:hypothetical protein BDV95DRAFT_627027 [Massariosphaeria phaeospora]|uniref:Tudor domain-containing protein n=1 Tax=Massariosphaeria phaeospora TaxID=100035 RepID=A0A7C8IDD4_9PLEO|nr:hypothetical protein BDV95DRAFT_627027 [Massariosphaeria phaeospora]
MADPQIKAVKDRMWKLKQDIQGEEKNRDDWVAQLALLNKFSEEGAAPEDYDTITEEISGHIAVIDGRLVPLLEQLAALEAQLPQPAAPAVPLFDPEKHPLLKKSVEKVEPEKPVVYNTGDIVEVQWTDKLWYKAKITTILGSASTPKYHVKFLDYEETMTADADAIRPIQNKRKRDFEPESAPAKATSSPHVITGAPVVHPKPQSSKPEWANNQGRKERTIGSTKALNSRVNNWKDFTSKGVGKKVAKKESMFRSGTTVDSRVGFTGSGAGMTETVKRVRYDTKADAEEEIKEAAENDMPAPKAKPDYFRKSDHNRKSGYNGRTRY